LAALHPGRRGVRALAVVAAVVVLMSAFVAWHTRPHTVAVSGGGPSSPAGATSAALNPPPPASSAPATVLVVAVEGKVVHPGLVRLPSGSRVADAIAAAGGALPGADLSLVNIAQKVVDGELIVVGVPPPPGAAGGTATSGGSAGPSAPINLNTATEADLETLPGIGPALAQRIIDYRTQHGGFHSVDELRNVSGIGDAKFAEIKDLVTV
jgi:competence protein ComEA